MTNTKSYVGSSRSMTAHSPGIIRVSIGDHWSAGDKGRSSQWIRGMGIARHRCAIRSFCLAASAGVLTHFIREDENCFLVNELSVPTHESLSGKTVGEVIPLEWIWRRNLEGSLWVRVNSAVIKPETLGFKAGVKPKEGDPLPRLHLECTTKYEPIDRKLPDDEARDVAKLSLTEWNGARKLVARVSEITDAHARKCGFYFPDGKVELGRLDTGKLIMADTFGTPDENRIIRLSDGEIFSKDIIRHYLRNVGYMTDLKEAQDTYPNDPEKWPDYPPLPDSTTETVAVRYSEFTAAYAA